MIISLGNVDGLKETTLALPMTDTHVLMGIKADKEDKSRSIGHLKVNGYGGHIESYDSSVEVATHRELLQESGLTGITYVKVGEMTYIFPKKPKNSQFVHIYAVLKWSGEPRDTDEMIDHRWYPKNQPPFDRMWDNDKYWFPLVMEGKKVRGRVVHDGETTLEKKIDIVDQF